MIQKIILFTILSLSLFAQEDLEKVSLQFHWKYQFEFAGFIAAKEKGFYKDVGLDVELREFIFGQDVVKDVVNKKATYGILDSYILVSYLQGTPLKLISSYFKRSVMVLITQPEIKSFQDLNNKIIMGPPELLQNILTSQKVDLKSLHFKEHTFDIQTFIDRKCDAMTAFISDQPYKLNQKGIKYNILDPSDYGVFNLQLELFTSDDEAKNHFKRVKNFKAASIKGWIYALEHKEEIIDIILKKYKSTLSREALEYEAIEIEKLILPTVYKVGSIDETFLLKQFDLFKEQTSNIQNKHLNHFIFDDKSFRTRIDYTLLWQVIGIFSFILFIILFYTLRNKKLQKQIVDLNTSLEKRVQDEVKKNREKDQYIMQQSRLVQMGEMISMIAHQWRQPLNAISATAIAISIKAEMKMLDSETAKESATKISDYAQHLSTTIDDFRDFFKPNKKQVTTSLNAIVESTLLIVKSSIISKNIELKLELHSKEEFLTFKSELTQVLLNILQNAQDALIETKVSKPFIKIKTYKENEHYRIEVSDNGGGINQDIIGKIFDPYFSTKEKKNGTGLGLYMSKQIVEEHCAGKLLVENEADGVVFKIVLGES